MANKVTITPLLEGSKVLVYHVYLKSDGASGELSNEVIVDPADLGLANKPRLQIESITFHFAGFDGSIGFESGSVEPTLIWVLPEGADSHVCFQHVGGLKDRSSAMDGTGKLVMSTTGFTSSTDQGSMVIKLSVS